MHPSDWLSLEVLKRLQDLDSCAISNAIESFNVRLRNEGYADGSVRCMVSCARPLVGYAVPGTIRTASAPISGRFYYDRMEWWEYVATIPEPRVIVLQDVDHQPALGAMFGEIHAHICRAMGCVGYVTNGAVRDISALEKMGFYIFARTLTVSHAYAHIVDFGEPVEVGGLRVKPGDLLHGDRHGIQSVPHSIAALIPKVANEQRDREQSFIEFLYSPEFSLETLKSRIDGMR